MYPLNRATSQVVAMPMARLEARKGATVAVLMGVCCLSACDPDPVSPEELTVEDVIETLFLGTGRANAEGGCPEDPGGPHIGDYGNSGCLPAPYGSPIWVISTRLFSNDVRRKVVFGFPGFSMARMFTTLMEHNWIS